MTHDGVFTVAATDRLGVFAEIIRRQFPPPCRTALDLAAGHCKFAILAAELGLTVKAVDARTERVPFDKLSACGITFEQADLNSYAFDPSEYDLIFLLGILYHLTLDEQIALLAKCASRPAILDTHYSVKPQTTDRGYEGHIYVEDAKIREDARSALNSERSFWHTPESLSRLLYDAGYRTVRKVEPEVDPQARRSFYVCEP